MAKKLFAISLYDMGDGYKKDEDWKRYSTAYAVAEDMESAAKLAEKNVTGDIIVSGVNERVGEKVFFE